MTLDNWYGPAFSADRRFLAAGGVTDAFNTPGYVGVWNAVSRKRQTVIPHKAISETVEGVVLLPDDRHLLVSAEKLTLHERDTGKLVRVVRMEGIGSVAPDRACKRMICGNGEIWDLDSMKVLRRIPVSKGGAVTMSANGTRAATTYPLRVWDVATGKETFAPPGHGFTFDQAVFSPDDRHLITLADDDWIRVWDAKSGK